MTDQIFTLDNRECRVGADGKVLTKVTFGPEDWGAEAWVPYDVQGQEAELNFMGDFPKIPFNQILFVREFFAAAYETHKTEAFVYFSLDYDTSTYDIIVPPRQQATAGHVAFSAHLPWFCTDCMVGSEDFDAPEECPVCGGTHFKKTRVVGTAHSHGSMGAFHSGTDDANELDTTGFHITFGKVDRPLLEIAHSYVVAQRGLLDSNGQGVRFKENLDVGELIDIPFVSERLRIHRWVSLIVSEVGLKKMGDEDELLVRSTPVGYTVLSMSGDSDHYDRLRKSIHLTGGVQEILVMKAGNYRKVLALDAEKKRKQLAESKSKLGSKLLSPKVRTLQPRTRVSKTLASSKSSTPTEAKKSGPGQTSKSKPLPRPGWSDWATNYDRSFAEGKTLAIPTKGSMEYAVKETGRVFPNDKEVLCVIPEFDRMASALDPNGRQEYVFALVDELLFGAAQALDQQAGDTANSVSHLQGLADNMADWVYDDPKFNCVALIEICEACLQGRMDADEEDLRWFDVVEPLYAIEQLILANSSYIHQQRAQEFLMDLRAAVRELANAMQAELKRTRSE